MALQARRLRGLLLVLFVVSCLWLRPVNQKLGFARNVSLHTVAPEPRHNHVLALHQNYSMLLVIARKRGESIDWISRDLPGLPAAVYTVDDPTASLKPPKNKGNEAMVYFTYIIDNYFNLSDITVFAHAHKQTWHNSMLLGGRTASIVARLNGAKVHREGYVNLRCEWDPGCPGWITTKHSQTGANEEEAAIFYQAWSEILPEHPLPMEIGQACCAQFAVSRSHVQSTPLASWERYRTWLLNTTLSDDQSGRVWEYLWQYVFTGKGVWCPEVSSCYCDGFGVCFGSTEKMNQWRLKKGQQDMLVDQYLRERSSGGEAVDLKKEIDVLGQELKVVVDEALHEGDRYIVSRS